MQENPSHHEAAGSQRPAGAPGRATEVFVAFLKLGLTSFGGPIAHLGYMREEFVRRRGWLDDARFGQLLAVCQFLPGPASSQMGLAIGLFRGGWPGAAAAFLAFTLPSALLMFGLVFLAPVLDHGVGADALHGLKLVAVVVVAHGLIGMSRQLAPDARRLSIAAGVVVLVSLAGSPWAQLVAIALGGILGVWLCRHVRPSDPAVFPVRYGGRVSVVLLALFAVGLLAALAVPPSPVPTAPGVASAFYQAGSLVFGGGHVVLPLLQTNVVDSGWLSSDTFLAGYGAAQAMPGPMFSLAAYLGAEVPLGLPAVIGAVVALVALFLPGFLLLLAVLPVWATFCRHRLATSTMAGINAAVVGLLAAAFYDPVLTEGLDGPMDMAIAAVGFALLAFARLPSLWIVLWCVAASVVWRLPG